MPFGVETLATATVRQADLAAVAGNPHFAEALFSYTRSAKVSADAVDEFHRFFASPAGKDGRIVFDENVIELHALHNLMDADRLYFTAAVPGTANTASLLDESSKAYQRAIDAEYLIILRYYIDDRDAVRAYPKRPSGQRYTRRDIDELDPSEYPKVLRAALAVGWSRDDLIKVDRQDYERVIKRCETRLALLGKPVATTVPSE
jgi:hypothetical protein